jgi:hypothetical protein
MLITNFITYKCNTCKRTSDIPQDNLRVFIDRCTITNHCLGKLSPISIKKTRNVLNNSLDSSLTDWSKSQYPVNANEIKLNYLNTGNNSITLAVKNSTENVINLRFVINKNLTLAFQEYSYQLSNFINIVGKDNSSLKKVLRYSYEDTVLVYVNGELYEQNPNIDKGYSLSYGGDQITFNKTIFVQSNVRIIVYQSSTIEYSEFINFYSNEYETQIDAWNNVKNIYIGGESYKLFTCTNFSALPLNLRLNMLPNANHLTDSNLNDYFLLFANANYQSCDRNLISALSLSNIFDDNNYIKLSLQNSNYVLQCTSSSIEQVSLINIEHQSVKSKSLEMSSDTSQVGVLINSDIETNIIGIT